MKTSNQPFTRTTSRRNMSITLLAALFVAVTFVFAAPASAMTLNSTWMKDNASYIGQRTLKNVIIPGSHDTGTYALKGADWTYAGTQNNSEGRTEFNIDNQLDHGLRYFDLRAKYRSNVGDYVMRHGSSYSELRMRDVLRRIGAWVATSGHEQEIILLDIQMDSTDANATSLQSTCDEFMRDIGPYLLQPSNIPEWDSLYIMSLNEIWALPGHPRVIAKFPTCSDVQTWPTDPSTIASVPWDSYYANQCYAGAYTGWGFGVGTPGITEAVRRALNMRYNTKELSGSENPAGTYATVPGSLVTGLYITFIQATTTADCLLPLKDFVLPEEKTVLAAVKSWYINNQNNAQKNLNIISADFIEETSLVADVIEMNRSYSKAPVISAQATTASGATYTPGTWAREDVKIQFTCDGVYPEGGRLLNAYAYKGSLDGFVSQLTSYPKNPSVTVNETGSGPREALATCQNSLALFARVSFPVKIDGVPPGITASATKEDGTSYVGGTWTNQTVTLHFTCADQVNLSGLASCPDDQVFSTDGIFTADDTARDNAGNSASAGLGSIKIDKTPPTASAGGPYTVNEGASVSLSASGSDTLSGLGYYAWDLDNNGSFETAGQNATFPAAALDGPTSRTVGLGVTDLAGNQTVTQATVNVLNVAPTLSGVAGSTIDENGVATVSGNITDPGTADTFTLTIDWKEGGGPQTYTYPAGTTTFSEQRQYLDDNPTGSSSDPYAITLSIQDDDGGVGTASTNVTVNNVDPVARIDELKDNAGVVLGTSDAVLQGLALTVSESYSDVGTRDTRTAVRDWGDGTVEALGAITGATSGSHIYAAAGTYTLMLTVTDDDTGVGVATRQIVVVTPAGATTEAIASLRTATSTSPTAATAIAAALVDLDGNNGGAANDGALDKLQSNDPNAALVLISKALQELRAAEEADATLNFTALKQQLTLTAKSVAVDAINRAAAVASTKGEQKQVADAWTSVDQGQVLFMSGGDYVGAVAKFQDALQKALGVLAEDGV